MNGCNYFRDQIDEADKPNLLSFEVTGHLAQCKECERFANERTALRMLVASGSRVSAPVNFNAVLNARLTEVKARPWFWWLGSPAALRLGAATAGVVVMLFAAQYTGLLTSQAPPVERPNPDIAAAKPLQADQPSKMVPGESESVTPVHRPSSNPLATSRRRADITSDVPSVSVVAAGDFAAEDGGVVLVRGQNGDMDVQMPTVSVGAQPLLYVRASQRAVRNVGTSF